MMMITTASRGDLFRLMPADEQQLLFENTARAMGDSRIIH